MTLYKSTTNMGWHRDRGFTMADGNSRCGRAILVACSVLTIVATTDASTDADHDSIPDAIEDAILQLYRPILVYESSERYWPISAELFVRNSSLVRRDQDRIEVLFTRAQLNADPLLALAADTIHPEFPSSTLGCTCHSRYQLDLDDGLRAGVFPGEDGAAHEGMYGHVVPCNSELGCDSEFLVQYWQLMGFNEAGQSGYFQACGYPVVAQCLDAIGDHEGDWLRLDAFVGREPPYELHRLVYYHHGSKCSATVVEAPSTDVPVCYIEGGAHEWWPWPGDGFDCCWQEIPAEVPIENCAGTCVAGNPSHDGSGIAYRVPYVRNIGERSRPVPGDLEASLILEFNGTWGETLDANCDIVIPLPVWPWFFAIPFKADSPSSPMHQGYAAPPGEEDWPPLMQVVNLAPNSAGTGIARINDGGTVLLHADGRPKTIQLCNEPYDATPPESKAYSAPSYVCDAVPFCLSENGSIGGHFYCYSSLHDPVIWDRSNDYYLVKDSETGEIAHGFTIRSLHGDVGTAGGQYGAFKRYALGELNPTEVTGTPQGWAFNGAGGASNGSGECIASLSYNGWTIAARMSPQNVVTALESPGYHSSATDINTAGMIVGKRGAGPWVWPPDGAGFSPWGGEGLADCVNDLGMVGGLKSGCSGCSGAWLYADGSESPVLPLLDPDFAPEGPLGSIRDINNAARGLTLGYIVQSEPLRWMALDLRPRAHSTAALTIAPTGGTTTLEMRLSGLPAPNMKWWKQDVQLEDGPTPWGSSISGSSTTSLTISGLRAEDAGAYRLDPDGSISDRSTAVDLAFLEVQPTPGDLDGDGLVDGSDLGLLLSAWGEPAGDLNGDGTTDGADLGILLSGWSP